MSSYLGGVDANGHSHAVGLLALHALDVDHPLLTVHLSRLLIYTDENTELNEAVDHPLFKTPIKIVFCAEEYALEVNETA